MIPDSGSCRSRFHPKRSCDGFRRSFRHAESAIMLDRLPSGRVWIERTESVVQRVLIKIGGAAMKTTLGGQRELYSSPNGDRWLLRRDPATGNTFVRHEANVPSGGKRTDIDIGEFLSGGQRNPEHQALLRLIGTLVENKPETARH